MMCPNCGSDDCYEAGYEDGAGDYGNGVALAWHCRECDYDFHTDTYDPDPMGLDDDDVVSCPDCHGKEAKWMGADTIINVSAPSSRINIYQCPNCKRTFTESE